MHRCLAVVVVACFCCSSDGADCPTEEVTAPTAAVCAKATQTCLMACAEDDDTCNTNCMAADPAADACSACVDDAFTACANSAGCQGEYDQLACCIDGCADPDSDECYDTTCASQGTAYSNCIDAKAGSCSDAVCFKST